MKGVLIGAGYFAQFQAEAWKRLEGQLSSRPNEEEKSSAAGKPALQFAAVADPIPGKAKEFATKHGIARAYESVEEMLEAEKPDFADIATRPESHLELTRLIARRGVHVICQKPMAPTMAECVAMCEVCESTGVRLFIHENWRWQPWYRETRRILDSGALGRVFQISFCWRTGDGRGPTPYPTQPYFKDMPRLLVYEALVHTLDTYRFLLGETEVVNCQMARINPVLVGEDQALIQLRFTNGALGLIDANRISGPVPAPVTMGTMLIEGDGGTLRMSSDGQLWLARHGDAEQRVAFDPPTSGYKGDCVLATQAHLLECLFTGRAGENEGRDYLKTVELVEACYASARKS